MALGALQAIEAAGRKVNEDIYLVGVDALTEQFRTLLMASRPVLYLTITSHRLRQQQTQLFSSSAAKKLMQRSL